MHVASFGVAIYHRTNNFWLQIDIASIRKNLERISLNMIWSAKMDQMDTIKPHL